MKQSADLRRLLESIDRKSYPAYKSAQGIYAFESYTLSIDHVQGDPFASPSKVSITVPHARAGYPGAYFDTPWKKTALEDYLVRQFGREIAQFNFKAKGSGKSGLIAISSPGPEILSRTACEITKTGITARFEVGFPAFGRTINSGELIKILFEFLPRCVKSVFFHASRNPKEVKAVAELAEDQQFIREELKRRGLVAFVADGAVLPRESGVSSRPMKGGVAFSSPESLRVEMELPHRGRITGMGIKEGITLIVGGGYHGKSTLLKALELGVYNHVAGDGREYVITDDTALKLRAEDGRSINNVDISLFINDLPNKKDTRRFSTPDASGSTSQAAGVIEGWEAGSRVFLIDEDTSATNFMLRDELMQHIISRDKEPITPFIERARDLFVKAGISTVLVAGSSGAYFYIADTIIQMDCYVPLDITEKTKKACAEYGEDPTKAAPGFSLPAPGRKLAVSAAGKNMASSAGRQSAESRGGYEAADGDEDEGFGGNGRGGDRDGDGGNGRGSYGDGGRGGYGNGGRGGYGDSGRGGYGNGGRGGDSNRGGDGDSGRGGYGNGGRGGYGDSGRGGYGNGGRGGYGDSGRGGYGNSGRGGDRGGRGRDERIKTKTYGKDSLQVGKEQVDLRFVEQLVHGEQTAALAQMVRYCLEKQLFPRYSVTEIVKLLTSEINRGGLPAISDSSYAAMGLCMPREQEIFACLNRYRG
ncbi:ABC-ATPase domain-containing protein [Enterocloster lavalensis]|uniref:ABC-ATPase domain-containing protein n=3 Tax=Enterocloster lavalensis TaxID=460384 RepID=UPI0034A2DD4A